MSRYPSLGLNSLAEALTDIHIAVIRRRGVRERNKRLVRCCDKAIEGSERARMAVARFMLTGVAASRPGETDDDS